MYPFGMGPSRHNDRNGRRQSHESSRGSNRHNASETFEPSHRRLSFSELYRKTSFFDVFDTGPPKRGRRSSAADKSLPPLANAVVRLRRSRSASHSNNARDNESIVPGYKFVKSLKKGGMSDSISLVKKNGTLYIEKRVRTEQQWALHRAKAELAALKKITHSHENLNYMVTSLWGPRSAYLALILEYCDGGSLQEKISSCIDNHEIVTERFAWHVLLGISNALAFLHAGIKDATRDQTPVKDWNAMCHLDIKPCNVFLSFQGQTGGQPRVVLGDFGCVVSANDIIDGMEHPRRQECGTPAWYPPEGRAETAGRRTRYGIATDTWQCGATVHAVCRLLAGPDRRTLLSRPCGRQFSQRLNDVVRGATLDDFRARYSSTKMVREALRGLQSVRD